MPGVVVKVDDRVILGALISSIALYLGLSWHRSHYVARDSLAGEAACNPSGSGDTDGSVILTKRDQARVSRLLELYFASLHDTERPFGDVPAIQASAQANDDFAPSVALMVERNCAALTDFTGEMEQPQALVIGCGVGGIAVSLAQSFPSVLAVDSFQRCIDAAKALQDQGCLSYKAFANSDAVGPRRLARVAADIDCSNITFLRADPLAFVDEVERRSTDAIVVAEILTLLTRPGALLAALPPLLRPGGVVCIATDYTWQDHVTPIEHQLAAPGCGTPGRQLAAAMEAAGFVLVAERELPIAVRQSERCLQLSMQHCTVWQLRTVASL